MSAYFDANPTEVPPRTDALPGTTWKQIVYAIRVWKRQLLHNPEDRTDGEQMPLTVEQLRTLVHRSVAWNRHSEGREWKAGVAKRSLMLAIPEIDEEVFEALVDGRLAFNVLNETREDDLCM